MQQLISEYINSITIVIVPPLSSLFSPSYSHLMQQIFLSRTQSLLQRALNTQRAENLSHSNGHIFKSRSKTIKKNRKQIVRTYTTFKRVLTFNSISREVIKLQSSSIFFNNFSFKEVSKYSSLHQSFFTYFIQFSIL